MQTHRNIGYLFLLVSSLLFSACKTKQKAIATLPIVEHKPDIHSAQYIHKKIIENEAKFNTLIAKITNKVTAQDGEEQEFSTIVRIKKDSVIWVSVNAIMGIEVARTLITLDSVKFINRLNGTFFSGNFSYLNRLLNVDLDYHMIQALLVGNPVEYYDDERLKSSRTDSAYVLSSVRKHKLKRVLQDGKHLSDPLESLWILPTNYKITRMFLDDFSCNRTFDVKYSDFQLTDSLWLPHKAVYDIKAEKKFTVDMHYNKIQINHEVSTPFKIPEKYTPIKQEEK